MSERNENVNAYIEELKKAVGKEVVVVDSDKDEFRGVLKAVCFTHLNVVLMTDTEKIYIKNIKNFRRPRSFVKS